MKQPGDKPPWDPAELQKRATAVRDAFAWSRGCQSHEATMMLDRRWRFGREGYNDAFIRHAEASKVSAAAWDEYMFARDSLLELILGDLS